MTKEDVSVWLQIIQYIVIIVIFILAFIPTGKHKSVKKELKTIRQKQLDLLVKLHKISPQQGVEITQEERDSEVIHSLERRKIIVPTRLEANKLGIMRHENFDEYLEIYLQKYDGNVVIKKITEFLSQEES